MIATEKKKVVIGGTFDLIHQGHQALLKRSFKLGKVTIGLTSDAMARRTRKRKIRSFRQRKKDLQFFIRKEFGAKAKIIKIEDKFGPTLKEDFDYIVVSPATYPAAALINRKRREGKRKPIEIIRIKFVLGKDKKPLSSSNILKELNQK